MASSLKSIPFLFFQWLILASAASSSNVIPKAYVVYMGSSYGEEDVEVTKMAHLQLLSSIIPSEESERINMIHHYHHSFKGFSAMLTDQEASALSGENGVVSVFPDTKLQLHTTRSWDFLEGLADTDHKYHHGVSHNPSTTNDVIIGIIDTGIWPESESFKDHGLGEIPKKWRGVCMDSHDFAKSNCNRKLIGARYYETESSGRSGSNSSRKGSARDSVGHGTHTASTAGGTYVRNASYHGLAGGTARGGWPSSRIASYKACSEEGCSGSAILKAIDDAVNDGVDIISISIGMSSMTQSDYLSDPIAIGAFHAEQKGVLVICSAGNDGPFPSTVVNTAPWIFTVAASTIDRSFNSTVLLGNGKAFQGSAITLSNLSGSKTYPLAFGKDVAADKNTPVSESSNCYPGSLNPKRVAGKIIVCLDTDPSVSRKIKKLVVEDAKAKGIILVNEDQIDVPFDSGNFSFSQVSNSDGHHIIKYINSTRKPTATILRTTVIHGQKPAPIIAYFSSRGPGQLTENILKPDITAPGVAILAATVPYPKEPGSVPSDYVIRSGTSMACPHVTGAAAFVKSLRPSWSSSMIRSALMTTARSYDNTGKPMRSNSGENANPHERGVGEINPDKALDPGLVFETKVQDYLQFLCHFGYTAKNIRFMSGTNFKCASNKSNIELLISNINYPSISVSKLDRHGHTTVKRSATNVGSQNATYISKVHAPPGLVASVSPKKLVFSRSVKVASFKVSFYSKKEASSGYKFGSITWSHDRHSVQMVFAVNVS